jgi:hypothetical protein
VAAGTGTIPVVPMGRRRSPAVPEEIVQGFMRTAALVARAKEVLLAAVPSPRGAPGLPLAEALLGFETTIREAAGDMAGWRAAETEPTWKRCESAIEEVLTAADRLRREAPALDYEALVSVLGDLMDPLAAFEEAERAVSGRR